MKQVLQYPRRRGLTLAETPPPSCKEGGITVDNRFSLISPGTERAIIELAEKNLLAKAKSRPDLVRQVLQKVRSEGIASTLNKVRSRLQEPIPLGYSCSGVIRQIGRGVQDLSVGDRVACAGFGYSFHADTVFVPRNLAVALPASLSFEEGAFVTLGAIALWGVRQSGATIGERVAVIGLGLLGQLTIQILKACGCQVVGIDINQRRLEEAKRFKIDLAVNSSDGDVAQALRQFTEGRGVDRVIITAASTSNGPIEMATSIARDRGSITVVGDVPMNINRRDFYAKELSLNISRSYGPGRYDPQYEEKGQDYPFSYVRWAENRNMQSFLELVASGTVDVKPLIGDVYGINDAVAAFDRLTAGDALALLLKYDGQSHERRGLISAPKVSTLRSGDRQRHAAGVLGAGQFATGVLLPAIKGSQQFELLKLYTPTPHKALATAQRFGFPATAEREIDVTTADDVDIVFISTPHNRHASQVMSALQSGKAVYVDKPLCLTWEELEQIIATYHISPQPLFVGFNRRFSPCVLKMRDLLSTRNVPAMFSYTINAGFVAKDSWIQDDTIGGGRIVGEGCHFLDLVTWLLASQIAEVRTIAVSGDRGAYLSEDNVVMQLALTDGSVGTITYSAMGDNSYPKETLTIIAQGQVLQMTDHRRLVYSHNGKSRTLHRSTMDKGYLGFLEHIADVLRSGQSVDEVRSYFHATAATLAAVDSLRTGTTMDVPDVG